MSKRSSIFFVLLAALQVSGVAAKGEGKKVLEEIRQRISRGLVRENCSLNEKRAELGACLAAARTVASNYCSSAQHSLEAKATWNQFDYFLAEMRDELLVEDGLSSWRLYRVAREVATQFAIDFGCAPLSLDQQARIFANFNCDDQIAVYLQAYINRHNLSDAQTRAEFLGLIKMIRRDCGNVSDGGVALSEWEELKSICRDVGYNDGVTVVEDAQRGDIAFSPLSAKAPSLVCPAVSKSTLSVFRSLCSAEGIELSSEDELASVARKLSFEDEDGGGSQFTLSENAASQVTALPLSAAVSAPKGRQSRNMGWVLLFASTSRLLYRGYAAFSQRRRLACAQQSASQPLPRERLLDFLAIGGGVAGALVLAL